MEDYIQLASKLREEALEAIAKVEDEKALEAFYVAYLAKKGSIPGLMTHMREVEDKNAISFERLYSSLVAGIKGTYKDMSLEEEGIYVLMADEDNRLVFFLHLTDIIKELVGLLRR